MIEHSHNRHYTIALSMTQGKQIELHNKNDAHEFADNLAIVMGKCAQAWEEILIKQQNSESLMDNSYGSVQALTNFFSYVAANPQNMIEAQAKYISNYMDFLKDFSQQWSDDNGITVEEDSKDRRFKDEAWHRQAIFDFMRKSYLMTSDWLKQTIQDETKELDEKTSQRLSFYTQQFIDAISPSNFFLTNPQVLRETVTSNGKNLVKGMDNLLRDLNNSKSVLSVSMSDKEAFKIGKNIACTPGKVIFQNDLMQLIQYEPKTQKVHKTPLLIVAPWINKYYILDLQQSNSFINWLVEQGHTVFVTSWVNPDVKLAGKNFDDYMLEGVIAALDAIKQATGQEQCNVIGYCIGGTLMAAALSYLKAKKQNNRVKSITYLTTLVDFSQPGDIGIFIDDLQMNNLEENLKNKGVFSGEEMSAIFRSLRSSDLIWSFITNNYLMGKTPMPFDILYWNQDVTAMPAKMYSFYLRKMYMENKLVEPGGIDLDKTAINLWDIDTPSYVLSTKEDHIAPWQSTYAATQIYKGPIRFVLSASGHVAGVVNPASKAKYGYWVADDLKKYPKASEEWFEKTIEHKKSWWEDWQNWIVKEGHTGKKVKSRLPGDGTLEIIEDAPGIYALG